MARLTPLVAELFGYLVARAHWERYESPKHRLWRLVHHIDRSRSGWLRIKDPEKPVTLSFWPAGSTTGRMSSQGSLHGLQGGSIHGVIGKAGASTASRATQIYSQVQNLLDSLRTTPEDKALDAAREALHPLSWWRRPPPDDALRHHYSVLAGFFPLEAMAVECA